MLIQRGIIASFKVQLERTIDTVRRSHVEAGSRRTPRQHQVTAFQQLFFDLRLFDQPDPVATCDDTQNGFDEKRFRKD